MILSHHAHSKRVHCKCVLFEPKFPSLCSVRDALLLGLSPFKWALWAVIIFVKRVHILYHLNIVENVEMKWSYGQFTAQIKRRQMKMTKVSYWPRSKKITTVKAKMCPHEVIILKYLQFSPRRIFIYLFIHL